MSVKISKLIESLQSLMDKRGDLAIGVRYQEGKVNAITGVGSTSGLDTEASGSSSDTILWVTTLNVDTLHVADSVDRDSSDMRVLN